ncbi:fungal-specific transcription factor domain-containing protein [Dactylonectria estremocensis]|uniref:Fungal-specific transcription factor domain-containing protein n=1 Tax=Dactylonectria estremocensis TaxID=1079267 RepID=A0A9P9FJV1_9HYPO|nr:fungal-specific transcription factor domain-containing protein [Dactylonectria estremocensis]
MKPKSGCWTCKSEATAPTLPLNGTWPAANIDRPERKIGCDKGLPHCNNCTGTGRECKGYGIRLLWPDRPDGRRSKTDFIIGESSRTHASDHQQFGYGVVNFLNVTHEDMIAVQSGFSYRHLVRKHPGPSRSISLHPIVGQDAMLLSYYEGRIATMISTTHTRNGFHHDLIPMALGSSDPASSALCNAMLAISAYHSSGTLAALPYKTSAVSHLSQALISSSGATETQMAASMMLCVYNVFDESEGNWNIHLSGARKMLQDLYAQRGPCRLDSEFTLTWFLYHEVLGCFTQPLAASEGDIDLMALVQMSVPDATLIIGSLGCSLETISIIHAINKMRAAPPRTTTSPATARERLEPERLELDRQLNNLIQTLPQLESSELPSNQARVLAIAELYRLASILYLQRVRPMPADDSRRALCLKKAFGILDRLQVATSPWPVFVIACESAPSDDHRGLILGVLDRMDEARGIGNIRVMRSLVEAFWMQYDLAGLGDGAWASWWNQSDAAVAEPWFI